MYAREHAKTVRKGSQRVAKKSASQNTRCCRLWMRRIITRRPPPPKTPSVPTNCPSNRPQQTRHASLGHNTFAILAGYCSFSKERERRRRGAQYHSRASTARARTRARERKAAGEKRREPTLSSLDTRLCSPQDRFPLRVTSHLLQPVTAAGRPFQKQTHCTDSTG